MQRIQIPNKTSKELGKKSTLRKLLNPRSEKTEQKKRLFSRKLSLPRAVMKNLRKQKVNNERAREEKIPSYIKKAELGIKQL